MLHIQKAKDHCKIFQHLDMLFEAYQLYDGREVSSSYDICKTVYGKKSKLYNLQISVKYMEFFFYFMYPLWA